MIRTSLNADRGLCIQRGRDDIALVDVIAAMDELYHRDAFRPAFAVIWDLRESRIEFGLGEIVSLNPNVVEHANEAHGEGRVAWVLRSAACETMIQMLYRNYPWTPNWQTFTKLEAAKGWCARGVLGGRPVPGARARTATVDLSRSSM